MTIPYPTGARPSPVDHRDFKAGASALVVLPRKLSWLASLPPVRNQGSAPTCVGNATATLLGFYENKTGWRRLLSAADAYAGAREVEAVAGGGAYFRAAFAYGQKTGYCLESDRPYNAEAPNEPGPLAPLHRAENKVAAYARAELTQDALKQLLLAAPLGIVIPMRPNFYTPAVKGKVAWVDGRDDGYHALVLAGYDDDEQCWIVRNSWGVLWGEQGNCLLSYDWPLTEAWVIAHAITQLPVPRPWWAALLPWWKG